MNMHLWKIFNENILHVKNTSNLTNNIAQLVQQGATDWNAKESGFHPQQGENILLPPQHPDLLWGSPTLV
jgi:hypothetical protein